MDLSTRVRSYGVEDRSWLASGHGTEAMSDTGVTLDLSLFTPQATYYPAPGNFIKSGLVLAKVTATGLFGPYVPAATDGRQTAVGLLFDTIEISIFTTATKFGAPLFRHGFVHASHASVVGLDAAARTAMPLIVFI